MAMTRTSRRMSAKARADFVNALRAVIGLEPIPRANAEATAAHCRRLARARRLRALGIVALAIFTIGAAPRGWDGQRCVSAGRGPTPSCGFARSPICLCLDSTPASCYWICVARH
jgi:hypothetical protein